MTAHVSLRIAPESPLRLAPFGLSAPSADWLASAVVSRQPALPHRAAIALAREALVAGQQTDGAWQDAQEANDAWHLLRRSYLEAAPTAEDDLLVQSLRDTQLPSGGWSAQVGKRADVSLSVQCYLALKLRLGASAIRELRRTREVIRRSGGAAGANAATRAWLWLFSQIEATPTDAGKLVGERRIVDPLHGVGELFVESTGKVHCEVTSIDQLLTKLQMADSSMQPSSESMLLSTAAVLEALVVSGASQRSVAVRRACDWLLQQIDGGTNPKTEVAILSALNTFLATRAANDEELPPSLTLHAADTATDVAKETKASPAISVCQVAKDLAKRLTAGQSRDGRWSDCVDGDELMTAQTLLALASPAGAEVDTSEPVQRSATWLRSRQLADGSWCSQTNVTAWALRALLAAGAEMQDDAVLAGINFLLSEQSETGAWSSDQESTCLVATAAVVQALCDAGFATHENTAEAIDWLRDQQNDRGGWGDSRREVETEGLCPQTSAMMLTTLARWATSRLTNPAAAQPVCLRLAALATVEE